MNRLQSSHQCRICRRWLEGEWGRAGMVLRASLERQMRNGMCDDCQRKRQAAAIAYERAVGDLRQALSMLLAAGAGLDELSSDRIMMMRARVAEAERACWGLLMWRPDTWTPPERFRGDRED